MTPPQACALLASRGWIFRPFPIPIDLMSPPGVSPRQRTEIPQHAPAKEMNDMAKSQKRSNREIRKPKAAKSKAIVPLMPQESSPVLSATRKPKGKL